MSLTPHSRVATYPTPLTAPQLMDTTPPPLSTYLPLPPLRADTDRLRAARHILCTEIEQALERFTQQTNLSVCSIDLELLSCSGRDPHYLVSCHIELR